MARSLLALTLAAAGLSACTTTGSLPPTEVVRYHLGEPIARGTIAVQPLTGLAPGSAPASLEFQSYANAVQSELARVGYQPVAPGVSPDFVVTVDFRRTTRPGPERRSPFSIGLGGGSFSGGRRGGGVGLGGGVSFPVGRSRQSSILLTELAVTIKRRVDQSPVWEGQSRGSSDTRSVEATADGQAHKLAAALFTGFPGQSGRTIEVK
jgi:hypothetical protein